MADYYRWAIRRYSPATVIADVSKLRRCLKKYGSLDDVVYVAERVAEENTISIGTKAAITNSLYRLAKFRSDPSLKQIRELYLRLQKMKPRKLPRIPSYETALAAIAAIRSLRFKAILMLALEAGLRLGEALTLQWAQVDFKQNVIVIEKSEKGSEGSIIPISDNLKIILEKLREAYPHSSLVIPRKTDQEGVRRQLARSLQRLRSKSDIFQNINVKNLRHIFATQLYARTRDLVYVQRMLRHRTILTTQRYVHLITSPKTYQVIAVKPDEEQAIKELLSSGYELAVQTKSKLYLRKPKT